MRWFKHDSDAHRDAKLRKVTIKYGMEGYGLYWYVIELIAAGVDEHNLTFELDHDSEVIAHDTGIHYERVQEIITYMVNLELFEESRGAITCFKLLKRLDQSMTGQSKFRKKIAELKGQIHDPIMTPSCPDHDPIMTESCTSHDPVMIKNRTEQNRKNIGRFSPPDVSEVKNRIAEMGYLHVEADEFVNFYGSKNWMVGKNKMSDWKRALAGWESREKKKSPASKETVHYL